MQLTEGSSGMVHPQAELFTFSRTDDGMEIARIPDPPSRAIDTSRAAKKHVAYQASAMRDRVLLAIRDAGMTGATRRELERTLGIQVQTLCARLWELEGGKIIQGRREGAVRIRKTSAIREGCHVYVPVNVEGR